MNFSHTSRTVLPCNNGHPAACDLIRQKARRAMERLPQARPYRISAPLEAKVEFDESGAKRFKPREGGEQLSGDTRVFRGRDILEAWLKYGSF